MPESPPPIPHGLRRIVVLGNAGSGKSTFARWLGETLGREVTSLDRCHWRSGWVQRPLEESNAAIREIVDRERWIIDGISRQACTRADMIILLDVPRRICLWRALWRTLRLGFRTRPEMPPHCPEIKILPQLLRVIWEFPRATKPELLEKMEQARGRAHIVHLHRPRMIREFQREMEVAVGGA
jgi:adenylate kinase family enzyme